jgi:peroxiredoxin
MSKSILTAFLILGLFTQEISSQMIENNDNKNTQGTENQSNMDAFTLMKPGELVPDFTLYSLDGKEIKFSELNGKTVFLNFFTLSCPMCMKELPLLEKEIWEQFKHRSDVVIMAIGREEPLDKLIAFREKKNLQMPVFADPRREVYSLFASQYVPRNIVINKEGRLVLTEVGFTEEKAAELFEQIRQALQN